MFAYVKILSGLNKNKKEIINTSEVLHFNAAKHNKNIKYHQVKSSNGKDNDICIILLLGDTKEQIENEIKDAMQANGNASQRKSNRLKSVPTKFLASASSSDENIIQKKTTPHPRTILQGQELDDCIGKKLEQFHSSVDDNSSEKYLQIFLPDEKETNKVTNKSSSTLSVKNTDKSFKKLPKGLKSATEDKENHTVKESKDKESIEYPDKHSQDKVRENNNNSSVKRKNQSPTLPSQSMKRLKALTSNTTQNNKNPKIKDSKDKQSIEHPDKNSQVKLRENNDNSVNRNNQSPALPQQSPKDLKASTSTTKQNEKPKITSNNPVDVIREYDTMLKTSKSEREVLQEKVNKLTKELESAKRDNEALKKVKDLYKKKYLDKNAEYDLLQKLNHDFQRTMIEQMNERDEMFQRLAESQKTVPLGCDFPSIAAFRMTDNMKRYHIGRDIWVSEKEYAGMLNDAKTPSQLAGHIVTLVFTMQELLTSTKSGYKSRRTGPGKIECGKLDEIKLNACEEYYKYWLQNIYTPTTKQDAKNLTSDMGKFYHYCGKKIADLKKPPTTSKKSKKKKNQEQDEDTQVDEMNEQNNHERNGNVINEGTQDNAIDGDDEQKANNVIEDDGDKKKDDDIEDDHDKNEDDDIEDDHDKKEDDDIKDDDDIKKDDVNKEYNSIQGDDDGNNSDTTQYSYTEINGNHDNISEDPLRIDDAGMLQDTLPIDEEKSDASNNNYYDWSPAGSTKSSDLE